MSEEKEQTVNIDGTDHKVSDLSKEQVQLVNHVADLDNQLGRNKFTLEQLQGARSHFMGLLNESLTSSE
jgi:hypothetical protein